MSSLAKLLILGLPVLLSIMLAGIGFGFAVLAREGEGRVRGITRIIGWINVVLAAPLVYLSIVADTADVQRMFGFCAAAFIVVGLMDLRFVARFDD